MLAIAALVDYIHLVNGLVVSYVAIRALAAAGRVFVRLHLAVIDALLWPICGLFAVVDMLLWPIFDWLHSRDWLGLIVGIIRHRWTAHVLYYPFSLVLSLCGGPRLGVPAASYDGGFICPAATSRNP